MQQKDRKLRLKECLNSLKYEQAEIIQEARKYLIKPKLTEAENKVFNELYESYLKTKYKEEFLQYSFMLDYLLE